MSDGGSLRICVCACVSSRRLCVCFVRFDLRSTAASSHLSADAYFSSVKITEKVEQRAAPKCN